MESLKRKRLSLSEKYKTTPEVKSDKLSVPYEKTLQSKIKPTKIHTFFTPS